MFTSAFRCFQKSTPSKKRFNLGDDDNEEEGLTHLGQSLSEIEKFDDPVISDDDYYSDEGEGVGKIGGKLSPVHLS